MVLALRPYNMLLPKTVTEDAPDRRRRPRLRLAYPVRLRHLGDEEPVETKTEDLSCEGFFCISDHLFSPHETVECELVIPSGEPCQPVPEHDIVLRCRAEVVRVVPAGPGGMFGVACRLADYFIDQEIVEGNLMVAVSI
jgi:hypothetical protein